MEPEWIHTTLGSVVELKRGYDLPQQNRRSGPVPIVSSSGISDLHAEAMVKGPGVVTGRYGTLGQVYFIDEDFWPLNTTLYVRDFKGNDPRFISYFLRSLDFLAYSDKAAVPGLNRNHLHQARVTLPRDLTEQRAIASILSALDDKIELNRRMNETLEGLAQTLFDDTFGAGDADAALGDLATIERDGIDPQDHTDEWFDHYSLPAFDEGRRPVRERGSDIKSNKFVVSPGCVLLSKLNPSIPRVWFSRVNEERRSIASTEFLVLRPTRASSPEYLNCLLRTESVREHLVSLAYGTSNSHQRVKPADLLATQAHRPSARDSDAFTNVTRPMFELVNANLAESTALASCRDALLPKLLSGEIRTCDIPSVFGRR